jgi:hypothetical protein
VKDVHRGMRWSSLSGIVPSRTSSLRSPNLVERSTSTSTGHDNDGTVESAIIRGWNSDHALGLRRSRSEGGDDVWPVCSSTILSGVTARPPEMWTACGQATNQ